MHIEVLKYISIMLIFVGRYQVFGEPLRDKPHGHVTTKIRKEPFAPLVIIGAVKEYITVTEGQTVTIACVVEGDQKTDKTWLKVFTWFHYISFLEIKSGKNEVFHRFNFERVDFRMAIELYSKMEVVLKTGEYNLWTTWNWLYEM